MPETHHSSVVSFDCCFGALLAEGQTKRLILNKRQNKPMKNKHPLFCTAILACSSAIWLTGCICPYKKGGTAVVCQGNEQRGLATIKCQPVDVEVRQDETAVFTVDATGTDLTYQWFFRGGTTGCGDVVGAGTTGGTTAQLTVPGVDSTKVGAYWAEIHSTGPYAVPVRTRTRDAYLGIRADAPSGTGTGGIQVYPPQQQSMPAPSSGSSSCGSHCGWLNYQNGGAGFDPDPGTTKGLAKVRIGTNFRNNTSFRLKWFDDLGNTGCASNSSSPATQKEFNINPNRVYFITIYFVSNCPAQGANVVLELQFVP